MKASIRGFESVGSQSKKVQNFESKVSWSDPPSPHSAEKEEPLSRPPYETPSSLGGPSRQLLLF